MGAGHAFDAIKRLEYNRLLKQMHRVRYNELKEAVSKIKAKYHDFTDRNQLTPEELKIYKQKIKSKIKRERQKAYIISFFITVLIVGIIYFVSVFLYNYFLRS